MIPDPDTTTVLPLTPEQTKHWLQLLEQSKFELNKLAHNQTEVGMDRALQFLLAGGQPYHCFAGDRLLTVMPDGDVYPCRRLPIKVGNLLVTPLPDIYQHAPLLQQLRAFNAKESCGRCVYCAGCKGRLRCLAFAYNQTLFTTDPGCWHKKVLP